MHSIYIYTFFTILSLYSERDCNSGAEWGEQNVGQSAVRAVVGFRLLQTQPIGAPAEFLACDRH
jgi:hypothetical protein